MRTYRWLKARKVGAQHGEKVAVVDTAIVRVDVELAREEQDIACARDIYIY
jgi:hypothetical protein